MTPATRSLLQILLRRHLDLLYKDLDRDELTADGLNNYLRMIDEAQEALNEIEQ